MSTPNKNNPKMEYNLPETLDGLRKALSSSHVSRWSQKSSSLPSLSVQTVDPGEKPDMTDYQQHQKMVKDMLHEEITPDEEVRRKKAASTVSAIGALGNALSAFSNLTFAGDVAPSQKLPETYNVSKDVRDFEDRTQKAREAYMRNIASAKKADADQYAAAWKSYIDAVNHNRQAGLANFNAALGAYNANTRRMSAEATATRNKDNDAAKMKQQEFTNDLNAKKHDLNVRRHNLSVEREKNLESHRGDNRGNKKTWEVEGETYSYLYDAYEHLPEEYKVNKRRGDLTDGDRRAALAKYEKEKKAKNTGSSDPVNKISEAAGTPPEIKEKPEKYVPASEQTKTPKKYIPKNKR